MKMTLHFRSEEFACRDGTPYPARWVSSRLAILCEMLEVIRANLIGSVRVLSGYRPPEYNRRIGGARQSQHCQGRAADIVVEGIKAEDVHRAILAMYARGMLKDLGGLGLYPGFVHVDIRPTKTLRRWRGTRAA
jgi:uncharacterized protein YcbK (DUF882 family)